MKNRSASHWLWHWAQQGPDRIALEYGDQKLSYAQLDAEVARIAVQLQLLGVQPGQKLAYFASANHVSAMLYLASARLNAIAVPLNPLWRADQTAVILNSVSIDWIVAPKLILKRLEPKLRVVESRLVELDMLMATRDCGVGQVDFTPPDQEGTSLLLFTSGSSGLPKAVMHGPKSLSAWTESTVDYLSITGDDRIFGALSLAFGYGLNQFLCSLHAGATYLSNSGQMTQDLIRAARDGRATVFATVPRVWKEIGDCLQQADAPTDGLSLRIATNAGGHLGGEDQKRLAAALGDCAFIGMYGMTETLRSTYVPQDLFDSKTGSLGVPVPGVYLALVNARGKPCAPGEPGEILHAGPTVAGGYLGAAEENARRFQAPPDWWDLPQESGLVCRTGDMAWQDDDGVYWYQSRNDRQLKVSGFRFGPHEVEDVACRLDNVADAALIELDQDGRKNLHLAVHCAQSPMEEEDILLSIRRNVASYMVPDRVHVLRSPLPKTANQKLDVPELRSILNQRIEPTQNRAILQ